MMAPPTMAAVVPPQTSSLPADRPSTARTPWGAAHELLRRVGEIPTAELPAAHVDAIADMLTTEPPLVARVIRDDGVPVIRPLPVTGGPA